MKLARSLFAKEVMLFGAVQILGLWAAYRFLTDVRLSYLVPEVSVGWHLNLLDLFVLAAFILIFIFLASKKGKASQIFFRIFLWVVVFSGAQIIFSLFLRPFTAFLSALAVVLAMAVVPRVAVLNLAVILG